MTDGDVWNLFGAGAALVALVGGAIARDRAIQKIIDEKVLEVRRSQDQSAKDLHNRINRTRENMVTKEDLQVHSTRVEGMLSGVQQQLNVIVEQLIQKK